MISLRRTALGWLAGLLLIIGLTTAGVSYLLVRQDANDFLDSQLRQIAYFIGDTPHGPVRPAPDEPQYDPADNFLVQIFEPGGGLLKTSDPNTPIPRQTSQGFSQTDIGGFGWRTYTFVTPERTVQVSERLLVRRELATDAALRSALPILALIPLCWIILGYAITRVMRRLDLLAARVEARSAADRTPIPLADVPTEVAPLITAMNGAMERLQEAVEQQRRFVSDAAHELRTPLAALQLQVENLRHAGGADRDERLADVQAGVRRSSNLVAQLLKLARYDADAATGSPEAVDLRAIVETCLRDLAPLAARQGVVIGFSAFVDLHVRGRPSELKVMVGNLIDNALRYTPSGGRVEISASSTDDGAVLDIRDTGCGIAPELLDRVFERFFRAAPQDIEGSGLGLAIARQIAGRNGLTLDLRNRTDAKGLSARIIIPAGAIVEAW